MNHWQGETIYNFSWTQVIQGFWCRYPNPHTQHVLTEDILETSITDQKLYVKKLITKKGKVPSYLQRFTGGVSYIRVIEETLLDIENKTMVSYTRNIDMQNVMNVHEKCKFRASDKAEFTVCSREVFSSSSVPHFGNFIASFGVKQYKKNIESTTKGFNYVLTMLFDSDFHQRELLQKTTGVKKMNYLVDILKKIHVKVKTMIFQYRNARLVCGSNDWSLFHHVYFLDIL